MNRLRVIAVAAALAVVLGGCGGDDEPAPGPSSSSADPTTKATDVDAARLDAVLAAVPVDGLEVREGGPRTCEEDEECLPGWVRTTLYERSELPERTWEATAGWLVGAAEPWHDAGWTIVYSVCAPTRAGTALVKELAVDGEPFVALARLDTARGERTIEVTVPLPDETDPWETTRTMLPDAACWQGPAPKELIEQSTRPVTSTDPA